MVLTVLSDVLLRVKVNGVHGSPDGSREARHEKQQALGIHFTHVRRKDSRVATCTVAPLSLCLCLSGISCRGPFHARGRRDVCRRLLRFIQVG